MALDLIFPLRDGGIRSGWGCRRNSTYKSQGRIDIKDLNSKEQAKAMKRPSLSSCVLLCVCAAF